MTSAADQLATIYAQTAGKPLVFCRAVLDWDPHPGQERWLRAPKVATRVLLAGRRWGKSEVEGINALYKTVTRPGYRYGMTSVTLDQARLSFDVAVQVAQHCPAVAPLIKRLRDTPFPKLEFKHGSFIAVRSAARDGIYLRGHKFHELNLDEADYLSERFVNEVARMTLADYGGTLNFLTTPKRKRGLVYREYRRGLDGDPTVYAQTGPTFDNPHVDHAYVADQRQRMPSGAFTREILGQYSDDDGGVFRWDDLQAAYDAVPWAWGERPDQVGQPQGPEFPLLREPRLQAAPLPTERLRYVMGIDPAGKGKDWTVVTILDATQRPLRAVVQERWQTGPYEVLYATAQRLAACYRPHTVLVDDGGLGDPVLEQLGERMAGAGSVEAFHFTSQSKTDLVSGLQVALEQHDLRFPFERGLVDELQGYEWDDKDLVTDCVMALALAVRAAGPKHGPAFAGPSVWS